MADTVTGSAIKNHASVVLWLLSGCFLIFMMVVVGGVTRLTGSGLSITRWDIITGTIPPLNEAEWTEAFELYKSSPQYNQINAHFGLREFKDIYWWEYIHRLIGRMIGFVFLVPFLWFVIKGNIRGTLLYKCLLLFALGGLQGFLGWFMVKSGLVDLPRVSHLRLAMHLSAAFITFGFTFWFAMELIYIKPVALSQAGRKFKSLVKWTFVLTFLQIIYGAFVAGMKAGHIYNTWPLMGDKFLADSFFFGLNKTGILALVNNMSGVQVMHRYLAYAVVVMHLLLFIIALRNRKSSDNILTKAQYSVVMWMVGIVVIQFILGIFTLVLAVPVFLGVLHQVVAFTLFTAQLFLLFRLKWQSVPEYNYHISLK